MHGTTEVLLTRLREAVADVSDWPFPEEDGPDVTGTVNYLVGMLNDLKRRLLAEAAPAEGEHYRIVETRAAKRSYNTNGLLAAFTRPGESPNDTLKALLDADVVRLAWRWTDLQNLANDLDVTLSVAKHEIADGDPEALVGEVWTTNTRVEGIK